MTSIEFPNNPMKEGHKVMREREVGHSLAGAVELAEVRGTPVNAWVCMALSRIALGTACQPRCVIPMAGLA